MVDRALDPAATCRRPISNTGPDVSRGWAYRADGCARRELATRPRVATGPRGLTRRPGRLWSELGRPLRPLVVERPPPTTQAPQPRFRRAQPGASWSVSRSEHVKDRAILGVDFHAVDYERLPILVRFDAHASNLRVAAERLGASEAGGAAERQLPPLVSYLPTLALARLGRQRRAVVVREPEVVQRHSWMPVGR